MIFTAHYGTASGAVQKEKRTPVRQLKTRCHFEGLQPLQCSPQPRCDEADYSLVFPAALALAHLALASCDSFTLAAALTLRLAFLTGLGAVATALFTFTLAHRAVCAAEIFFLAAALIFFLPAGAEGFALLVEPRIWFSCFSSAAISSLRPAAWRSWFEVRLVIVFMATVSIQPKAKSRVQ